jgi:hypothetical protein
MDFTAALFTVAVTVGSMAPSATPATVSTATISTAIRSIGDGTVMSEAASQFPGSLRAPSVFSPTGRPAPLMPLYASLAILQGFDIYTTSSAVSRGAVELNPAMKPVAGRNWASAAVKAASTAGSIYFIERAWKHNRKGAIILATALNVATAAIVAHNTQTAKR